MVYFSFHAIVGQRSVMTLVKAETQLDSSLRDLSILQAKRELLEHRVVLLRPATLDLDYAEELAFQTLGYEKPSQVTVVEFSPNAAKQ